MYTTDGTATVHLVNTFQTPPQVCILPLGTGNDLSQVLGWGDGYTGDKELTEILDAMVTAQVTKLDRWQVAISHAKHFAGIHRRNKVSNTIDTDLQQICLYFALFSCFDQTANKNIPELLHLGLKFQVFCFAGL